MTTRFIDHLHRRGDRRPARRHRRPRRHPLLEHRRGHDLPVRRHQLGRLGLTLRGTSSAADDDLRRQRRPGRSHSCRHRRPARRRNQRANPYRRLAPKPPGSNGRPAPAAASSHARSGDAKGDLVAVSAADTAAGSSRRHQRPRTSPPTAPQSSRRRQYRATAHHDSTPAATFTGARRTPSSSTGAARRRTSTDHPQPRHTVHRARRPAPLRGNHDINAHNHARQYYRLQQRAAAANYRPASPSTAPARQRPCLDTPRHQLDVTATGKPRRGVRLASLVTPARRRTHRNHATAVDGTSTPAHRTSWRRERHGGDQPASRSATTSPATVRTGSTARHLRVRLMNWEEIAVAAPAAFLLGVIVGYIIRGRYHLEKARNSD